jgi:hypothetical protein
VALQWRDTPALDWIRGSAFLPDARCWRVRSIFHPYANPAPSRAGGVDTRGLLGTRFDVMGLMCPDHLRTAASQVLASYREDRNRAILPSIGGEWATYLGTI